MTAPMVKIRRTCWPCEPGKDGWCRVNCPPGGPGTYRLIRDEKLGRESLAYAVYRALYDVDATDECARRIADALRKHLELDDE